MSHKYEDVDLCAPETHDDPWEMYEFLRENDPIFFDKNNEVWYAFRYEDIKMISRDPETYTSTEGNRPNIPNDPSLIHKDGEDHRIQRGLVAKGFSPKFIRSMEPNIRTIVEELVEKAVARGEMDLIEDFAAVLPMRLIGDMLGVPVEKHETIRGWINNFLQGGCGPQYVTDDVNDAFDAFIEHHYEMIEERGENPEGDDLLSRWMRAEFEGKMFEEDQLIFDHVLLNVGGAETTRNAIGGGFAELIRHPDQWDYLRANLDDDAVVDRAIEEFIRWVTPFHNMFRTLTKDVELHGKQLKAGQMIGLHYPAANRDPKVFENPYQFDIKREKNDHLSFGLGPHFCLGASLARMELKTCITELMRKVEKMELDDREDAETWISSSFIRGPKHVHVKLTAAK